MKHEIPLIVTFLLFSGMAMAQMSGPPRGGPPAEAFAACQGSRDGDDCSFEGPPGTLRGQCRTLREGRPVCVPEGMGPGGERGTDHAGPPGGMGGMAQGMEAPPRNGVPGMPPGPGGRASRVSIVASNADARPVRSRIPDTGQGSCFDNTRQIPCPSRDEAFGGQDASYIGAAPTYRDNKDGTVTDRVTGLMWQQGHNTRRLPYRDAEAACGALQLGGHDDWRLPGIRELFSLADFRGVTGQRPYLNEVFEIRQPGMEVLEGDRFASTHAPEMMGQTWSSTLYTGVHYGRPGVKAAFFFNFLDGRIKQAPVDGPMGLFYRCVRGAPWGSNDFADNRDSTVSDRASGLMWQQRDDGVKRDWPAALAYCNRLDLAGHRDWRLPNVKELQSIVDYSRWNPALDPRYLQASHADGWFWSSTTLGENLRQATYVCFGPCTSVDGVDVHGAGAQRSDPKVGDPAGFSPQGGQRDEVRINNYARCVRSSD